MMSLLDGTLRLSIVVGVALLLSSVLRGRSAALRHAWLAAGLLLAALVAPLSWMVPPLHLRLPAWDTAAAPTALVKISLRAVTTSSTDGAATAGLVIVSCWLVGAVTSLIAIAFALARLRQISRRAVSIEVGPWREVADEVHVELGRRRRVHLIEAPGEHLVATWGVWRPRILVPSGAADWPRDHIRAVLGHEMAHVARCDWLVQTAAYALCAWQWFNPVCWMALRRLRELSEMACDDAAMRSGLGAREYALRLVEVTRASRPMTMPSAAVPMARPSSLERRIAAMLDSRIDRRLPSGWALAATFGMLSLLVVPVAALRAQAAKPAESAAAAKSTPLKVGGAVKPPRKIHDAKAVYPEAMKKAGITGDVELEVTIAKDGGIGNVHVLTTNVHPDLAVAAVDAVRQWKFEPTLLNGAPVEVMVTITVTFRLK